MQEVVHGSRVRHTLLSRQYFEVENAATQIKFMNNMKNLINYKRLPQILLHPINAS
jgi:hypothetical protein